MNNKILHYGLIITFAILYLATAFVSFYHAIEFFNLSNERWLSVILSLVAEIGQATVLFSLLMSTNKNKIMPWVIMFILTALQVIGNVYSCYVFIEEAASPRFLYFQKSILFFLEESPENMKVIVAWITGSLLPIIALCLTSLVAENLHLKDEDYTLNNPSEESPAEGLKMAETQNDTHVTDIEEPIQAPIEVPMMSVSEPPITYDKPQVETETVDESAYLDTVVEEPIEIKKRKPKKKQEKVKRGETLITDAVIPNSTNNIENIDVK